MCAAGGYLYALGGHEAPANTVGGRLACVERYDPVADTWVLLARLSYGRDAIGSCLLGDRIVAVGENMFPLSKLLPFILENFQVSISL